MNSTEKTKMSLDNVIKYYKMSYPNTERDLMFFLFFCTIYVMYRYLYMYVCSVCVYIYYTNTSFSHQQISKIKFVCHLCK